MICSTCLAMFSVLPARRVSGSHHQNETHLRTAADAGCKICVEVICTWSKRKQDNEIAKVHGELGYFNYDITSRDQASFHLAIKAEFLGTGRPSYITGFNILRSNTFPDQEGYCEGILERSNPQEPECPWSVYQVKMSRSYPTSTGHPDVAEGASLWLESCRQNHSTCRKLDAARDTSWKPKRLLDISKPRKPRLAVTALEDIYGGYATLSHCWGQKPDFLQLSFEAEEAMRRGISFKRLPRTFRDAIFIAHRLGINYLWIDSLCILQSRPGSSEDWAEHDTAMRKVYENCIINIAADRTSSAHEKAFTERSPFSLQSCQILWGHGDEKSMWTVIGTNPDGNYYTAPLTSRVWVFQERILSPRVLHLGMEQVWWECNDLGFACESMPTGFRRNHPHFGLEKPPFSIPQNLVHTPSEQDVKKHQDFVWREWQRCIETYARSRLSFPEKDVFAAFAGVAEKFGSLFGDDYVAGHFSSMLPIDLLAPILPHTKSLPLSWTLGLIW